MNDQTGGIEKEITSLSQQAHSLCALLERGQSDTPLVALADLALSAGHRMAENIVLVATDEALFTRFWEEICRNGQWRAALADEQDSSAIRHVSLSREGLLLTSAAGDARLSQALTAAGLSGRQPAETSTLRFRCITADRPLSDYPALESKLTKDADLLIFLSPVADFPATEMRRLLGLAYYHVPVILPLFAEEAEQPATTQPQPGNPAEGAFVLRPQPLSVLSGDQSPFARESALAKAAGLSRHAKMTGAVTGALKAQATLRLQELRGRKQREVRRSKKLGQMGSSADLVKEIDVLRKSVTDDLSVIQTRIEDSDREALFQDSAINRKLRTYIRNVGPGLLDEDIVSKARHLTIGQDAIDHITGELRRFVSSQMTNEYVMLRDFVEASRSRIAANVQELLGRSTVVNLGVPDLAADTESVARVISRDMNWKGRIPSRSFLQRLGEGRRTIFMILMMVSIMGAVLGTSGLRQSWWISPLIIVGFFGAVIMTYFRWKEEDEVLMAAELDKAHMALETLASRNLSEIYREKARLMKRRLDEIQKALQEYMGLLQRDSRDEGQQINTNRRAVSAESMQRIDSQIMEASRFEADAVKLDGQIKALEGKVQLDFKAQGL